MRKEDLFLASILFASLPKIGRKRKKSIQPKTAKNVARIRKEKAAKKARRKNRK